MVATVTKKDSHTTSISLNKVSRLQAEEVAIVLAITQTPAEVIITDSQSASRSYLQGRISCIAMKILGQNPPKKRVSIVWTPAHASLCGNVFAHETARGLTNRAPRESWLETAIPVTSYQEVTQFYRLTRLMLPAGHPSLSKAEERSWRLLQTNTFPHPTKLHLFWPKIYYSQCQFCNAPCTLYHMVWECQLNPSLSPISNPSIEQWEEVLASSSLEEQLRLIHRAEAAGRSNGVLN